MTGESFTYDANGNRQSDNSAAYTTGLGNRLATDGDNDYLYDAQGNRTTKLKHGAQFTINDNVYVPTTNGASAVNYNYDLRNRLVGVEIRTKDSGGTLHSTDIVYTYDVDDRRTSKQVSVDGTTTTNESYAYDGSDLTTVFNSTSTITDRYLYDEGGQVLSDDTSAGLSWYLADHEGSIRKVLSATGSSTLATYTYDAYGNVTSSQQPDRFGYTGQELDAETGLSYYGARYLDTLVGGFINQDPGGDGTNPYEYVHSDPIDLKDPTGMYASEVYGASRNATTGTFADVPTIASFTTSLALAASGVTDGPISGASSSEQFDMLGRGRFVWHRIEDELENGSSIWEESQTQLPIVAAQQQIVSNNESMMLAPDIAARIQSAGERRAYLTQAMGIDYALQYENEHAAELVSSALATNNAAGYDPHKYDYSSPEWENKLYAGPVGGMFHALVANPWAMDAADAARPVMTAAANIGSFIPGFNSIAIPAAITLHSANSYASGAPLSEVGKEAATEVGFTVAAFGASKLLGMAWGTTIASGDNATSYAMRQVRRQWWLGDTPVRSNALMPGGREYMELSHTYISENGFLGKLLPAWIKNRRWNLNPIWGTEHALVDPGRYQFMPAAWKAANPLPNAAARLWGRMPVSHRIGAAGGALLGGTYAGYEVAK